MKKTETTMKMVMMTVAIVVAVSFGAMFGMNLAKAMAINSVSEAAADIQVPITQGQVKAISEKKTEPIVIAEEESEMITMPVNANNDGSDFVVKGIAVSEDIAEAAENYGVPAEALPEILQGNTVKINEYTIASIHDGELGISCIADDDYVEVKYLTD